MELKIFAQGLIFLLTRVEFLSSISMILERKTKSLEGGRYELCTVLLAECEQVS